MATQWPLIQARLVHLTRSLPGWDGVQVFDGPAVTGNSPTAYLTVGYVQDEESAGSFAHTRAGNGFQVEETGTVRCELVCTSGGTTIAAVRTRAFALIDALEVSIRADQTLGLMPQGSTTELSVDVNPRQDQSGAQQRLPFTVNYFIRT